MTIQQTLFLAGAIFTLSGQVVFASCIFEGSSLQDLKNNFKESKTTRTNLPKDFKKYKSLEDFDPASCAGHVAKQILIERKTRKAYLAIYTNDDGCDGGNSYGLIYDASSHEAIAIIKDSAISCL